MRTRIGRGKSKNKHTLTKFFRNVPMNRALDGAEKAMQDELEWQLEQRGLVIRKFEPLTFYENPRGAGYYGKLVAHTVPRR